MQAGASNQHRPAVALLDVGQGPVGRGLEVGHAELLGRVDQVEQMVGHLGPFGGRGGGGTDVHAPVDGHGVHGDQLDARPATGHLQG